MRAADGEAAVQAPQAKPMSEQADATDPITTDRPIALPATQESQSTLR
jgi:hypothetical protein